MYARAGGTHAGSLELILPPVQQASSELETRSNSFLEAMSQLRPPTAHDRGHATPADKNDDFLDSGSFALSTYASAVLPPAATATSYSSSSHCIFVFSHFSASTSASSTGTSTSGPTVAASACSLPAP